jgi:hypothetical protein
MGSPRWQEARELLDEPERGGFGRWKAVLEEESQTYACRRRITGAGRMVQREAFARSVTAVESMRTLS